MHVLTTNAGLLGAAFAITLLLSVGGGLLAVAMGTLAALARLSPISTLRGAATGYVATVRNTPLTVVFFLLVFAAPEIGIGFSEYTVAAIVALGCYTGAFVAEAIRAGVLTVGLGQAEAGRSLGLSFTQNMRFVIGPQAVRAVVPPLANVWIALVKNTSVAAGFGVLELTAAGQRINFEHPEAIILALGWIAVAYLCLTLGSSYGFRQLERRLVVAQ